MLAATLIGCASRPVLVNRQVCGVLETHVVERTRGPWIRQRRDLFAAGELVAREVDRHTCGTPDCKVVVYGRAGDTFLPCPETFRKHCAATFVWRAGNGEGKLLLTGQFLFRSSDLACGEVEPIWSPDRRHVVLDYDAWLHLADLERDETRPISPVDDPGLLRGRFLGWSPDGRGLAVAFAERFHHVPEIEHRLLVVDPEDLGSTYLATRRCPKHPAPSCWADVDLAWRDGSVDLGALERAGVDFFVEDVVDW